MICNTMYYHSTILSKGVLPVITNRPKIIVFDLDGTLYEDTHHFDFYINSVAGQLNGDIKEKCLKDYKAILNNEHPLKVGRIYDALQDLIIVQLDNRVQDVYDWNGFKYSKEKVEQLYSQPIHIDMVRYLSIGDLWWVPSAIGVHYGLELQQTRQSFFKTREYMMGPDFNVTPVPGLKSCLEILKENITLVLITNSPEVDSEEILNKLGLNGLFTEKIFRALKPSETFNHFKYLSDKYSISFSEILSIGDNYINEILPVQSLSCQTIYIDPHNTSYEPKANITVSKISEIIPILNNLVSL